MEREAQAPGQKARFRDHHRPAVRAPAPQRPRQPHRRHGLILEGAVLAVGDEAMRPGELFALHWPGLDFPKNLIHIHRQLDLDTGETTWSKDDDGRYMVMSPAFRAHVPTMPRLGKIVFPAPRGGYMLRSS